MAESDHPPPGFSLPSEVDQPETRTRTPITPVMPITTNRSDSEPPPLIDKTFILNNYDNIRAVIKKLREEGQLYSRRTLTYDCDDVDEEIEMEARPSRSLPLSSQPQNSQLAVPPNAALQPVPSQPAHLMAITSVPLNHPGGPITQQYTFGSPFPVAPQNIANTGTVLPTPGIIPWTPAANNLHHEVNGSAGGCLDQPWKSQKTPFVSSIQNHPLPIGMKIPSHLGYYEGKDDPDDFINIFEGASRMSRWDTAVACHAFSYVLKSDARVWFNSLAKDSISSFEDLKRLFRSKFSQQKKHKKNHVTAHSIKQKDGEASRAFLVRFTDETQQIPGLPESQRISGLLYGCRTRALVEHLSRDLPDTYEMLLDKAYVWLDAKDTANSFVYEETQGFKRKEKPSHREEKSGRRNERNRFSPYRRENTSGILGTLMKSPKEILATEKAAQAFKAPPKLNSKGKMRDTSKFCDFHNDFGHETDDCIQLRQAIEEAVRSGKLTHLVKGIRNPKVPKQEPIPEEKKPDANNAILTVAECFAVEKIRTYKRGRKNGVIDWEEISFPALDTITPSDKPVTINGRIFEREVHRVYLDGGSACDIMYEHCFDQLSPAIKARLSPPRVPRIGFSGERCWTIGEVDLDFTIGEPPLSRTETLDFVVVRAVSQHNILLGRVAKMKMGIIASTIYQLVKFYTPEGIGTLASTYDREKVIMAIREIEERPGECILETREKGSNEEKISVNPLFPEQQVVIGGSLPPETKKKLRKLLQANIDIFAWEYRDMTGIPRVLSIDGTTFSTEHKLNEYKHLEPIHQKKRNLANERDEAACKEVEELLQAGIIREAKYPTWVANPVMVKKSDGGWRMCVDFTNINKACPKDCYPLPEIDWKVESLTGYKYKCFLDAYKGYHQIQMAKEDEEKTSFFTSKGIYCYRKMPFGLKNAGATYQRLVDKVFRKQLGRNLEAYVDDMVIKSPEESTLLTDIQETFNTLRSVNMKLNPKKCSFGVEEGKFLGYYITKKGIIANPEKIDKLQQLKTPTTVKEM
ncbi:uncharacterized protein [Rutidosis leptorrhynchoides]|uniref:uncharacterized protein n=1 Tax=Rutidosis leptorrhynchoides TaxID=125765 RepID=UPI003A98F40C